jgi:hypothetical protein
MKSRDLMTIRLAEHLPPGLVEAFCACSDEADRSIDDLRKDLIEYREEAKHVMEGGEFSDRELAEELVDRCALLLDSVDESQPEIAELVKTAVTYLVRCDDASSDAMSIVGLADDAKIVAAVERIVASHRTS